MAASSREFRDSVVGKRISGVIARPGRAGEPPMVLMMRFDDGSVVEFVSPRSDQLLRRAMAASRPRVAATRGNQEVAQLRLSGLAA